MTRQADLSPTVALVNDTSLYQSHFGCELVGQTFREQFARTGLTLRYAFPRDWQLDEIEDRLGEVDLVVVNGEGSIHHGKRLHLVRLAERFPCVLVNTVYQDNPAEAALAAFLYRSARESASAEAIRSHGYQCDVTPDAIFASSLLRAFVKPSVTQPGVGITDSVKRKRIKLGPLRVKRRHGFAPMGKTVAEYLVELGSHERLCIGRFHGMVAASVLEIPFSCWRSNTWKIESTLADMGVPELCHERFEDARENVPLHFDPRIKTFADEAADRVREMFDTVASIASGQSSRAAAG